MALLAVIMMASVAIMVPHYVEHKLIPGMALKYGLDARKVHVRDIGWFGAELGPIHIDGANTPVVRIAAVHVDYAPLSLLRGNIKHIALGGVRVVLRATPEGISIPGLNLPTSKPDDLKPDGLPDLDTLLPIAIEKISLDQSEVVLLWKGQPLSLSIDMTLGCGALDKRRLTGSAELSFLGSTIVLTASLDQLANSATLTINKSHFALGALAALIDLPSSVSVSSTAALKGRSHFKLTPFGMTGLSLSANLVKTHITLPHATVENLPTSQGLFKPIIIAIESPSPPAVQWRCNPFLVQGPATTHVQDFKGEWTPGPAGWSLKGSAQTLLPAQAADAGWELANDVTMAWQFRADPSDQGAVAFDTLTTGRNPLALDMPPFKITCPIYHINTKGRWTEQALHVDGAFSANNIQLVLDDDEVVLAKVKADSSLSLHPSDAARPSELSAKATITGMRAKRGSAQVHAPRLDITSLGKRSSGRPWHYQAHIKLEKSSASDSDRGIQLDGIQLDMPLLWPPEPNKRTGALKVQNLQWRNHRLGSLKGRLQQKNRVLEVDLRHDSKLFPKLNVLINGRIGADGGAFEMDLPVYQFPEAIDLGRFFPDAAGLLVKGQIEAKADFPFDNKGLQGSAVLKINQASLLDAQRQLGLEGIEMNLVLDDSLALKSAPQQHLRIGHLSFGKIVADTFEMDFQLEGPQTLFIEKSRIQWCRGSINTTALRIAPARETYDVTLFGDRLNLAMVLEQLGAGQASGEGTVNGAIPVHWHKGRLSFDNGFLYSTPGKPGVIQLTGTEMLLTGLPPDTPQHTQVDIATEALKDYTYKWAKLSVASQDDNLLLKLQLDGKPNQLLPFAFDKQLGRFKRVDGQGLADFKGISIDLNFKSPLDKILHYKELLTPNQ